MTTNDSDRADATGTPVRKRDQPPGAVDFTMMYLTHDAFLRDLRRLEAAVAAGRAGDPAVRNGWQTFKEQLHSHHVGEDEAVWPQLREKLTAPEDIAVLDLMEAEHGQIDPLQERIDAAFETGGPELEAAVKEFTTSIAAHMEHEEDQALPLVETHLGPEGWANYSQFMLRTQTMSDVGAYFAWLLDGASNETRNRALGPLPPPLRYMLHQEWEPAYRSVPRWSDTPA
ncbi:hemerythrin domain-containing protein [Streptomyces litchfieldiae]|uniref:Hemerythrin domain-containing protein n=1 Tax=Streptomyces litchfieldiae TaxID=3075543 RepID=A0ABU2MYI1_9ACTN|nr:hemerythrin domain-containing protein [Streptomyces sp. DSM 44938]MDT0346422.1 hemerythrin domain-containing protein [Streptomyces sp. DSM 44938]